MRRPQILSEPGAAAGLLIPGLPLSLPPVPPVALAIPVLILLLTQVIYVVFRLPRRRYRLALGAAVLAIAAGETLAAVATGGRFEFVRGPLTIGGLHVLPDLVLALGGGYVLARV